MRQTIVLTSGTVAAIVWLLAPSHDRGGSADPSGIAPVLAFAAAAPDDAPPPAQLTSPATSASDPEPNRPEGRPRNNRPRDGDGRPGMGFGIGGPGGGLGGPGGLGMGGQGNRRRPFPGPGLPRISNEDPTDDEWAQIVDFWKQHGPNRLVAFEEFDRDLRSTGTDLTQQGPYRMVKRGMAWRYRMYDALKAEQPNMAQFSLEQFETEDQAFGTYRELRTNAGDKALESKFHDLTVKYVDTSLEERKARIKDLEDFLNREKQRLTQDSSGRDELVGKQDKRFKNQFEQILSRPTTQPNPPSK